MLPNDYHLLILLLPCIPFEGNVEKLNVPERDQLIWICLLTLSLYALGWLNRMRRRIGTVRSQKSVVEKMQKQLIYPLLPLYKGKNLIATRMKRQ